MNPRLHDLLYASLDDPRRAALLGATGGALKGALVGVALGKLALGIAVGAAGGAATALLLRQLRPRGVAVPR